MALNAWFGYGWRIWGSERSQMTNKTPTKSTTWHFNRMLAGLFALTSLPGAALAQAPAPKPSGSALPTWQVAEVCKRDSVTAQCDLAEQRAAGTVSGSWAFVPEDVRAKCLADSAKPVAQSWRLLSGCIETAMSRNIDRQAVLTAKTPTEPVPPRKILPMVPPAEDKSEIKPSDAATPPATPAAVAVPAAAAIPAAPAPAIAPAPAAAPAPTVTVPPAVAPAAAPPATPAVVPAAPPAEEKKP